MEIGLWFSIFLFVAATMGLIWLAITNQVRWIPSLIIRGLLLILAGISLVTFITENHRSQKNTREILLLDLSDSIAEKELALENANVWKGLKKGREVIAFGGNSEFVLAEYYPDVLSTGSDLLNALKFAEQSLAGEDDSRIIIATDGNIQNITEVTKYLQSDVFENKIIEWIRLDEMHFELDPSIRLIHSPDMVWVNGQIPITLSINSEVVGSSVLETYVNQNLIGTNEIDIGMGENQYQIYLQGKEPGILQLEFKLEFEGDQFLGNNAVYKAVQVLDSPSILMISQDSVILDDFVDSMKSQGAKVDVISPEQFETQVSSINSYDVIFIHNILASDLSYEQMKLLEYHVLEKGKTLFFLGGENSFTLGGYNGTLLEPLLPVELEPPSRVERVPVTFLLVLDRSGSMAGDRETDISPIELTKEAAIRVFDTLRPADYLGILTFSGITQWDVPIVSLEDSLNIRTARDAVSQIVAGGGTFMYRALDEAIEELLNNPTTENLHILLMSDGTASDASQNEFEELVAYARSYGVSISTIALGQESDPQTLSLIARLGNGRFYEIQNASELPNVMVAESRAVQSENIQLGTTNIVRGESGFYPGSDLQMDLLPSLEGYVALKSKSNLGAEDILVSGNFGDPILSVWQVGLGHVGVWTADFGEEWVVGLEKWSDLGEFWIKTVEYALPNPNFGLGDVEVDINLEEINLRLTQAKGKILDSPPTFTLLGDGNTTKKYSLSQYAGGKYQVNFPLLDYGAYRGVLEYDLDGVKMNLLVPFEVNYPNEWLFVYDDALWEAISVDREISFEEEFNNTGSEGQEIPWYDILLILLIISWPIEIGIRRWKMPWREKTLWE